ncbi:MAG: hypothetical protein SF029_02890 [bacterium]|nr:hypothetical protein [bacterium]
MLLPLRILAFLFGTYLIGFTLISAIRFVVLPRAVNVWLVRMVFLVVNAGFQRFGFQSKTYEQRDRRMAMFAPISVMLIPVVWLLLMMMGYALVYWGMGYGTLEQAVVLSGSSLLTLGTIPFPSFVLTLVMFSEAVIGLVLTALLIAYLPTMYSAFSQREAIVSLLEVYAGSPPSVESMVTRLHLIRGLGNLHELWETSQFWFVQIEESHTSLGPVSFFRSPKPDRSWVTTAGVILDAASFIVSTADMQPDPQAQLCIRSGYLTLRSIADFFNIQHNADPHYPDEPISISREEYDEVYDALAAVGVPLKADRDQAWEDFAGWRVNYDRVLLRLAALTMAPYALWSSDRSLPIIRRRGKVY